MNRRTLIPFGLSLLSIAGAQPTIADLCDPLGGPPAEVKVLIGNPDCSLPNADCKDAIASRDGTVLQIEGNHNGEGQDALEHWQAKVVFDVSSAPLTGFYVFVDLRLTPTSDSDSYHWYDEAVLVCTEEDVIVWPVVTLCPSPGASSHLVLRFHFPSIPGHCIISESGESEIVRVLWRGAMVGDHPDGADDREVDRLGIDP